MQAEQEEADDGIMRPKVRRTQVTVSESVRAKHAAEQAALERAAPLPEAELAAARRTLVQHMQARETVMAALTRLGGKRGSKVCAHAHPGAGIKTHACLTGSSLPRACSSSRRERAWGGRT